MEQLGLRECGTFTFRMDVALEAIADLRERYEEPKSVTARTGDLHLLFGAFDQPGLAVELFNLLEKSRIQGHLLREYPGLARHLRRYYEHLLSSEAFGGDALAMAQRFIWGERELDNPLTQALNALQSAGNTVYDSVRNLCALYDAVAAEYVFPQTGALRSAGGVPARLAWSRTAHRGLGAGSEGHERHPARCRNAGSGTVGCGAQRTGEGEVREADVDIRSLADERDTLQRRIDMERSSVQHALGADRSSARSFRYDEWNYLERRYLTHWCRVYEEQLASSSDEDTVPLKEAITRFQPRCKSSWNRFAPPACSGSAAFRDGDELDLNAIIEARQDIRAGQTPDERFYSRKERMPPRRVRDFSGGPVRFHR